MRKQPPKQRFFYSVGRLFLFPNQLKKISSKVALCGMTEKILTPCSISKLIICGISFCNLISKISVDGLASRMMYFLHSSDILKSSGIIHCTCKRILEVCLKQPPVKNCYMGANFIYLGKIMRSHKNGCSPLVELLKEVL